MLETLANCQSRQKTNSRRRESDSDIQLSQVVQGSNSAPGEPLGRRLRLRPSYDENRSPATRGRSLLEGLFDLVRRHRRSGAEQELQWNQLAEMARRKNAPLCSRDALSSFVGASENDWPSQPVRPPRMVPGSSRPLQQQHTTSTSYLRGFLVPKHPASPERMQNRWQKRRRRPLSPFSRTLPPPLSPFPNFSELSGSTHTSSTSVRVSCHSPPSPTWRSNNSHSAPHPTRRSVLRTSSRL